MKCRVLGKLIEGSDFELVKYGNGNKLLAVAARLCLPPTGCFSTLGICKGLRLLKMSKRLRLEKVGNNA